MGLISAGDEALKGIENVVKVVEDVLIFDNDFDAHVERVRQVLLRCNEAGMTLHPKKFVFAEPVPEVDYCGFKVGEFGYTISDRLVRTLTDFPVPVNKTDVRSFCWLAQQFEPFTPELTELLEPLRPLTYSNSTFVWEEPQQQAFERTIKTLSDPRMLANFDGSSPLRLETDAAQSTGLGMALWQQSSTGEWRLLQCASRHITDTETRYSATEIEPSSRLPGNHVHGNGLPATFVPGRKNVYEGYWAADESYKKSLASLFHYFLNVKSTSQILRVYLTGKEKPVREAQH